MRAGSVVEGERSEKEDMVYSIYSDQFDDLMHAA